ncbi:hypothetical protein BQ8420_19710 [Nocardiopsis sp. JB363]|nr:hypothetical protein BQ8420_19710 [Nocardiopsis sp. JB363]
MALSSLARLFREETDHLVIGVELFGQVLHDEVPEQPEVGQGLSHVPLVGSAVRSLSGRPISVWRSGRSFWTRPSRSAGRTRPERPRAAGETRPTLAGTVVRVTEGPTTDPGRTQELP